MFMFLVVMEKEANKMSERNALWKERYIFKTPVTFVISDKPDPELSVFFTQKAYLTCLKKEGTGSLFSLS